MSKYLKEPFTTRAIKWMAQYLIGFTWIWQYILYPIISRVFRLYKWTANGYMKIWNKFVYTSEGVFSRFRAAMLIIMTCLSIYVIPNMIFLSMHGVLYSFTAQREVIYLTNSQEIDAENDIHAIKGCEFLPCNNDNSVYYRVSPTNFAHAYSIFTEFSFFYPDLVASVVAPGLNKCTVDSYGIRIKTLMRKGDLYPWMLNAECMPMGRTE